jgi:hypothetical protein
LLATIPVLCHDSKSNFGENETLDLTILVEAFAYSKIPQMALSTGAVKYLPADYYVQFLSDAAKSRRPGPSKFLTTILQRQISS